MKAQPGVWGIDVGQCALKALRLQEIEGNLVATAFDYVEHPKILNQPDADPDQLTREALETFLKRNTLGADFVCISVPGQTGLARFVKLPPVEEKKIADIVRFEAKQQIPFNLDEVVWDFQKIGAGTVTDGFAMDTEIGLFAMKRDQIGRYLQHFKDVNVEVHIIQMAPLALCNFAAYDLLGQGGEKKEGEEDDKKSPCIVVLDIGTDSSNLVITDGGRIIWQRPIPLGGNHFTRALTKDMKLTFAKAEHLKRNATKSPDLKKILTSLKPVLNDFAGEIQRSLGYFTNTHRDSQIDSLIGLGNAFRLPGLQRFLEEKLQLTVKKLGKMERLAGEGVVHAQVYQENVMTFGVAYGLALQGIKRSRLMTNLLPPEIRTDRLIRAKKPWAAAAAAALLLGLGGVAVGYGQLYRSYAHPDVVDAEQKVEAVAKKVKDAEDQFQSAKSKAEGEEKSVDSIVAGQGETLNWLELTAFINRAIPRPDGENLPPAHKKDYFDSMPPDAKERAGAMSGKMAYEAYKSRQENLKMAALPDKSNPQAPKGPRPRPTPVEPGPAGDDDLGAGIDDLVQVNVEGVSCRYADDLGSFWGAVMAKMKNKTGYIRPRVQAEEGKGPTGHGWVVEIRGYTFHHQDNRFLVESFVENIARMGLPDFGPAVAPVAAPPQPAPKGGPPHKGPNVPQGSALPDKGPVINRISHVVLLDAATEATADTQRFSLINSSDLDNLVGSGGGKGPGGPGGPGPGGPGGPAAAGAQDGGSGRGTWTPLGKAHRRSSPGQPRGPAQPTTGGNKQDSPHRRTEFVIVFVWNEPMRSTEGLYTGSGGQPGAGRPSGGPKGR